MLQALYTGLSGLKTSKAGINVSSNNISNANTEGFNKRILRQESNPNIDRNSVLVGTGSSATTVERFDNKHNNMI